MNPNNPKCLCCAYCCIALDRKVPVTDKDLSNLELKPPRTKCKWLEEKNSLTFGCKLATIDGFSSLACSGIFMEVGTVCRMGEHLKKQNKSGKCYINEPKQENKPVRHSGCRRKKS